MNQTQLIDLSIVPGGVPPIVHIKQNDTGRTIEVKIFDEANAMDLSDTAYVMFSFRRGDGSQVVVYDDISFSLSTATVTVPVTIEMSAVAGRGKAEIAFYTETNICLASADFILDVDPAPAIGAPAAQEIDRRYGESPGISNIHKVTDVEIPASILERVIGDDDPDTWGVALLTIHESDGTERQVYEFTRLNMVTRDDIAGWFTEARRNDDYVRQLIEGTIKVVNNPLITEVGDNAFTYNHNLGTIVLYDVTRIGNYAFFNIYIGMCLYIVGKTIPTISRSTFNGASQFTIRVRPDMVDAFRAAEGWRDYADRIHPFTTVPTEGYQTSPTFKKIVERTISAISWKGALIYAEVFRSCTSLKTAHISKAVIYERAFYGCTALEKAYFTNVTSFGEESFRDCRNLMSFYVLTTSVPKYGSNMFTNTPLFRFVYTEPHSQYGTIYVLSNMVEAFRAAEGWSYFASLIQPYTGEE